MKYLINYTGVRFRGLLLGDIRNILREPVMLMFMILAILPLLLFILFQQTMDSFALKTWQVTQFSSYIAPLILLLPAYLIGWVTGFLILEERDEGPLLALSATPIGKNGVAIYRAGLAFIISAIIALFSIPFLLPGAGLALSLFLTTLCSIQAAMVNFILPAMASNKVQGLAMSKAINLFALAPLLAFIPSTWRFLASPIPGFWIGELTNTPPATGLYYLILLPLAMALHLLALLMIYRFFSAGTER